MSEVLTLSQIRMPGTARSKDEAIREAGEILVDACAVDPAYIMGARIDLQQAVLNVLTNAMDAVAECMVPNRLIHVRVATDDRRDVRIVVRDSGEGFMPGTETRAFEPFFTTKPARMGMGLAVARSIVENQGGVITAANGRAGGAAITIVLPGVERRVPQ